jgi:hypothetical protein
MKNDRNMTENIMQNPQDKIDFSKIEYQKSTDAYFQGVEIGFKFVRSFFLVNGFLFTLLNLIISKKIDFENQDIQVIPICGIGIVSCIFLFFFATPYGRHLTNCMENSKNIEANFGGSLFHRISLTSHDKSRWVDAIILIKILSTAFLILWIIVLAIFYWNSIISCLSGTG